MYYLKLMVYYVAFRYDFDVTKCMFSAGNITEKLRVSQFDCRGETVVDLYAGEIIVFFLPIIFIFIPKGRNMTMQCGV